MTDTLLADQPIEPKNFFEALTAPGGKFDRSKFSSDAECIEAIAKGKWHADSALTVKERAFDALAEDTAKLRENANTQAALTELIDQLKTTQMPQPHTPQGLQVQQPQYDEKQLESLIDNRFEQNVRSRREQENFNLAKSKLVSHYGANYASAVTAQLEDLGMTEQEFNHMARTNPKLFERTFVPAQTQEGFQAPPRSSGRFAPQQEKRTWAYYQKLKQDNPRVYEDNQTQLQLMKDYAALGVEFEDGDWQKFNK